MTVDRYTKGVLTVIAGCLLFLCAMTAGRGVSAQPQQAPMTPAVQPVVILGWGEMTQSGEVVLARDPALRTRLPYSKETPLPVAVESAPPVVVAAYSAGHPLPVTINGIREGSGEWDPIRTRVEGQRMGDTPGPPKP